MKSFFQFTSGEWAASMLMAVLILAGILFYFLYENTADAHTDYSAYQELFAEFETEQQRLADSVALARSRRPYYRYENDSTTRQNYYEQRTPAFSDDSLKKQQKTTQYTIIKVELNSADTNDIMRIPQFGSKRAQKIVEYRNKLGGFYSLSQIKEIYILQNVNEEYLEKYFYIDRKKITKININTCDYKTIVSHPYFDSYLAKTILNHRQKNGSIENMQQFKDLTHIYPELEAKLTPYLEF